MSAAAADRGPDALAGLRTPWLDLWRRCAADPFQHPDWILAWWDIFRPGPSRLAAVWEGDRLVALAPLYEDPASGLVLPMGVGPSDRTDCLVDPGRPQARRDLAAAIVQAAGSRAVHWPDVPRDGVLPGLPPPAGFVAKADGGGASPAIDLGPGLAAVPSSRWRKWRMAGHRAARRGDAAILTTEIGAPAVADRLVALNTQRFDPQSGGVFADPRMAAFVRRVIPALAEAGILEALVLTIGGIPVAVHCGFRCSGRSYAWLGGFDPAYAFESPGTLLMGEAIRRAVAHGDRTFELLRGDEAYKRGWGASDVSLLRVTWRDGGDG